MPPTPQVRVAGRPRPIMAVAAVVAAVAATWAWAAREQTHDVGVAVAQLPWPTLGCLVLLPLVAVVHFACAGAALRGVSGRRLPWRETALVQLAAAASNRLVPNGLGGAAVNGRYLLRHGLTPGAVASALGTLAAVGALTDAAYVAGVTTLGPVVGLGGAGREIRSLMARSTAGGRHHLWLIAAVLAVGLGVAVLRLRGRILTSTATALRHAVAHVVALGRHPHRVSGLAAASMATTAVLGAGFVAAVRTWGHAPAPLSTGALLALYWAASAAGNATPLPALFGLTEAALAGGLVVGGYSAPSATTAVIVFRLVTFWLPLPVGVWATRQLRRESVL